MTAISKEISQSNFSELPTSEAVYAIFAADKSNTPINCRYVGETNNLSRRTGEHFDTNEENECLKEFMQSDKTKILVYELMINSDDKERLNAEKEWIAELVPICNK